MYIYVLFTKKNIEIEMKSSKTTEILQYTIYIQYNLNILIGKGSVNKTMKKIKDKIILKNDYVLWFIFLFKYAFISLSKIKCIIICNALQQYVFYILQIQHEFSFISSI